MATLAPQKEFNVTFPENVTAFLYRRAKRDQLSVPQTLTAILTGIMEDEEDGMDDPYFNKTNMARIRESIAQAERGELVKHDLIEV